MVNDNGMRIEQLAECAGVPERSIRFYVSQGILPPPQRVGREARYHRLHLDYLAQIRELQEREHSLAEIREILGGGSNTPTLPSPVAWSSYELTEDVRVLVRTGIAPQRLSRIKKAMAEFMDEVQPHDVAVPRRNEKSPLFRRIFTRLGIGFHTKATGTIDNNRALRYGDQSIRMYFNDATTRREAYFAASPSFYEGFGWTLWRDVDIARRKEDRLNYFKKVPQEGEEQEAFEALLDFLTERHPDRFSPIGNETT